MEGNSKRSLIMVAVALGVAAVYFLFTQFFGGGHQQQPAAHPQAQHSQQHPAPTKNGNPPAQHVQHRRQTATIRTDRFIATIDNLGGGILADNDTHTPEGFRILGDERFANAHVITTARPEYETLRISLPGVQIPADAVWDIEQVSPTEVRLSWTGNGVRVIRSLSAGHGPYQIWQTVRVQNVADYPRRLRLEMAAFHYVRRADESGGFIFASRSPAISHGLCSYDDELVRKDRDKLVENGTHGYAGQVYYAAVENVYFVQALAAHGAPGARCTLQAEDRPNSQNADGALFQARLVYPATTLQPGQQHVWQTLAYIGPKDQAALHAADHQLPEVVELGWFAIIGRQLLRLLSLIHQGVGSWGLSIILMTLLVRLVLSPLTARSFKSAARMRQLKPEMDRINELYADDREKKSAATMELYRKHKINPLGGCLPQVLQLPIWWALYQSLSTNIELYHVPFALWPDLSARDPYFVLPLTLGVLMHVQQRITPTSMDPTQAKMMMWMMPIMITAFMLFLPSGLCLYMLTNSVLGIGQQKLVEWQVGRAPAAPLPAPAGPVDRPPGNDDDDADADPSARASAEKSDLTERAARRGKRSRRVRRGRA